MVDENVDKDLVPVGPPGMKGFYIRPSRAIEKGGGFFVPGLEGDRIRIISSVFLLALCIINASGMDKENLTFSQAVSILTGGAASLLLFTQGIAPLLSQLFTTPDTKSSASRRGELVALSTSSSLMNAAYASSLRDISRAVAATCYGLKFIAAFEPSQATGGEHGQHHLACLLAFGPADWAIDPSSILPLDVATSTLALKSSSEERFMLFPVSTGDEWIQGLLRNWPEEGGGDERVETILLAQQPRGGSEGPVWLAGFDDSFDPARSEKWLRILFSAPSGYDTSSLVDNES